MLEQIGEVEYQNLAGNATPRVARVGLRRFASKPSAQAKHRCDCFTAGLLKMPSRLKFSS